MEAHFLGTQMGLLPNKERDVIVRTIDTGGCSLLSLCHALVFACVVRNRDEGANADVVVFSVLGL
jgi:hypothetical protein